MDKKNNYLFSEASENATHTVIEGSRNIENCDDVTEDISFIGKFCIAYELLLIKFISRRCYETILLFNT